MASRYQWRKYNLDYDYSYRIRRQAYTDMDAIIGGIDDSFVFFTSYTFDRSKNIFKLGNRKGKFDLRLGDKIYAPTSWVYYRDDDYRKQRWFSSHNASITDKDNGKEIVEFVFNNSNSAADLLYSRDGQIDRGTVLSGEIASRTAKRGSYIETVEGYEGQYPNNGEQGGYWYVYDRALNNPPRIYAYDTRIGSVRSDFDISYRVVDDSGDRVRVGIEIDGRTVQYPVDTQLDREQTYRVRIDDYTIGDHTIRVTATDSSGESDYVTFYFTKSNQAPTISGSTTRIGTVRSDFDIRYTVYDADRDKVKVQVMVDDRVIQYPMETTLGVEQTVRIRLDDYSLGNHSVTVTATDSSNASATRTYYFTKSNQAPTISGYDLDLGGVFKDVSVDYIVQDADGDSVEVKISLDGAVKQAFTRTTLGVRKTYTLPIKSVSLGRHKLEIEARDSQGASSVRTYSFEKVNSAPVISGYDTNLGAKNTAFSYKYTIADNESDNVKVVEKLNGSIIRTLYNITLGQEQTITISDEQIKAMDLHKQNTIEIEASDGTATVYRRINFTRNNMPPIISDQDKDLGELTEKFEYKFSATDPEEDKMVYSVSLDDRMLVDREPIADGREKSIAIDGFDWIKLRPGKHTIKIYVEDDKGFKSTRTINFARRLDRIVVQLAKKGIETDAVASRVLISDAGIYAAKGTIAKLEVCNNSFDTNPTWEDATTMFKAGRAFNFQNKSKTASKAGVNIRVTIGKGESTAPSYITAVGGSFD